MIRKLFRLFSLSDALTASMNTQQRILLALALASVGYRCIAWGLRPADGGEDQA